MKWRLLAALGAALSSVVGACNAGVPMTCYSTRAAGVPLKVVVVDLTAPGVTLTGQLCGAGPGHAESFTAMVRRTRPAVAITGTFFCNRSLRPIGDIVIDGRLVHYGGIGTGLCFTDNRGVQFVAAPPNRHHDWHGFDFVMRSGPRLITDGVALVVPGPEGFHDRHMLRRNPRIAIGVTRGKHLVIVATRKPVYLSRLAKAMRALGVVDAINLDGGSSVGVYYRGKVIIRPSRPLTNLILVYDDRRRLEARNP